MDTKHLDSARLLIIEDDDRLAGLLLEYLGMHGLETSREASGEAGAERILEARPDLVILDLMLPGMNGLDVCRRVRGEYPGPIVMLTASQSEADHVAGLELGADDFVIKPIEPRVLLARIRTQLRRLQLERGARPKAKQGTLEVGPLQVDTSTREATFGDRPLPLTGMEFDVLAMLAREAGTVVSRETLYAQVLGIEYDGIDRGMDVHVSRIRRKLEGVGFDPARLKSIRAMGYLLAVR